MTGDVLSVSDVAATAKAVFSEFSEQNVTLIAAGIAYNAFASLAPLLLLLLLVVSLLGGGLEARLVDVARQSLPGPIADVVVRIFEGNSAAASASFVGLVVLVWGSLKIFRGLDTAFSEIYGTEAENTVGDQLKDGAVVLVGLATAGASAVFAALSDTVPGIGLLTPLALVFGLVLAFFPMYYVFPDTELDWRQVVPGVAFSAVGWAALQSLFQVYLVFKGGGSANMFGGIVLVVTWLYFSGLVLLLGAVVNAVVSGHAPGVADENGGRSQGRTLERRETLDGEELARYLRTLRESIAGRDGVGRGTARRGLDRTPMPNSPSTPRPTATRWSERSSSGGGAPPRTVETPRTTDYRRPGRSDDGATGQWRYSFKPPPRLA
ncbi:ribonuclease BN [Halogeometricum pallidum JCM 14848]|uniref:Ribonuclease BN n=1 Tax=Halogeometricum pallidum JCM 14848 TaxID=1227487 RepID=M0CT66_HALPD|nr:YihY/virulence factor BrkB family protein [Halogeometricum pallidum]ELZ26455.1 ribonuclease BN [Halogeometricum pallidum JCM 14848]